jgi:putative ABC transport system substrate-binding protein
MMITQSAPITTYRKRIVDLAEKHRLLMMYPQRQWPDSGGLMSYGSNIDASYRHLANYVDRILKGAKALDLPVEQSTDIELIINLRPSRLD